MSLQPLEKTEDQNPDYANLRQQLLFQLLTVVILSFVVLLINGGIGYWFAPFAAAWAIINTALALYRKTQQENFSHYRQLEALASLHALIRIRYPLPPLRLWSISPDFAALLVGVIHRHKPRNILELGSGSSTLIACYALEGTGTDAQLTSVEHGQEFADNTQKLLETHGFAGRAHIIHAPLETLSESSDQRWYSVKPLRSLRDIDLLIIDGPPDLEEKMARYPALPVLFERLVPGALILLDDYARSSEHETVNRWLKQFALEVVDRFANDKGAILLRKLAEDAPAGMTNENAATQPEGE